MVSNVNSNEPDRELLEVLIKRTGIFKGVPHDVLKEVSSQFQVLNVPAGTQIIEQGAHGDELYLIESGQLEVTATVRGKHIQLGKLGPGDVFGEMALIRNKPRSANVTASTPARMWVLSARGLAEVATRDSSVLSYLHEVMRARDMANALKAFQ